MNAKSISRFKYASSDLVKLSAKLCSVINGIGVSSKEKTLFENGS